jgi:hypothetical protein
VGKRLLQAKAITTMRDIRTPELKELLVKKEQQETEGAQQNQQAHSAVTHSFG